MHFLALFGLFIEPLPPASNLWDFPTRDTAIEQRCACREHAQRLRDLGHVRGWEGGTWEDAAHLTEFYESYWWWILQAHDSWGEQGTRTALHQLKHHIGPARYLKRWAPPLAPILPLSKEVPSNPLP